MTATARGFILLKGKTVLCHWSLVPCYCSQLTAHCSLLTAHCSIFSLLHPFPTTFHCFLLLFCACVFLLEVTSHEIFLANRNSRPAAGCLFDHLCHTAGAKTGAELGAVGAE